MLRDTPAYQQAFARYEVLRPVLQGQRTLGQQRQATGLPSHRLWHDRQRFQRAGLVGLLDHRTLPYARSKITIEARVPLPVQQQIVRLALAHPFTAHALAQIIQTCDDIAIDHRGIQRVLALYQLSPDVLQRHDRTTQQAPLPRLPADDQGRFTAEPTTRAQRLTQALGPAHLLMRLRTSREYPTEEQARWRIIERLEVGFRPRRVAAWLAIDPHVVYYWQQRFQVSGFPGLTTRTREATPITTRIPVHVMMEVFQLLDNHPLSLNLSQFVAV